VRLIEENFLGWLAIVPNALDRLETYVAEGQSAYIYFSLTLKLRTNSPLPIVTWTERSGGEAHTASGFPKGNAQQQQWKFTF